MNCFSRLLHAAAVAILICVFPIAATAQTWQPLGPDYVNQASYRSVTLPIAATGPNGATYLYYRDQGNNMPGNLRVRRYVGPGWTDLPSPADSFYNAVNPSFLLDTANAPCLSFERSGTFTFYVMRFNGNTWVKLHGPTGLWGRYPKMVVDKAGRLVVATMDPINGARLTVIRYNGASWDTLGQPGFSVPVQEMPEVAIGTGNLPYVACKDLNSNQLYIYRFNGNSWSAVTPPGFTGALSGQISLSADTGGAPWVSYTEGSATRIRSYDGTYWSQIGDTIHSLYPALNKLAFSPANVPYCFLTTIYYGIYGHCYKWNGTTWDSLNVPGTPQRPIYSFHITPAGAPTYAGTDNLNFNKAEVRRFNSVDWPRLGDRNFSEGDAPAITVAPDYHGGLFTAYIDSTELFYTALAVPKIVVQHFDGAVWQQLGPAIPITSALLYGPVMRLRLAADTFGRPFLLSEGMPNTGIPNIAVYRFDGTSWLQIFQATSNTALFKADLAVSATGTPYLLFQDGYGGNGSGKLVLMKWPGSTGWQQVGDTINVSGPASRLRLSRDGRIFILCNHVAPSYLNQQLRVITPGANGHWQALGPDGSFPNSYQQPDLAVSPGGVPIVGYRPDPYFGPVIVKRFNGTRWDTVGTPGFVPMSPYTAISLDTDAAGTPYMAYLDVDSTNWARQYPTLMRYNGSSWEEVGQPRFTVASVSAFSWVSDGTYAFAGFNALGAFAKRILLPPAPVGVPTVRATTAPAFRLYPNPAAGLLTFERSRQSGGDGLITILDMTGRVLLTYPCTDQVTQLDVSLLSGGTYLLRYSSAGGQSAVIFTKE